ncbi:MAG: malonyl-CoA decarboxylase [Proteobacteria bacterium]|nr:malonyl-CoA decarboxylase [Pseudomonadota bacterium]MDA1294970.1 malonyl-CoA decarboxylase [Pseudomonadota bacterium]
MTILADLLRTIFERNERRSNTEFDHDERSITELCDALITTTSETSALMIANKVLTKYSKLHDDEKLAFFQNVSTRMSIDPERVREALEDYEKLPSRETYQNFSDAAEPSRQELIRRLNQPPGATQKLVEMRADLLRLGKNDPVLQAFDLDIKHLFASWFNRGFLVLRPISWESPAHILEKIIAYEAVHAIDSWEDLRRRLEPVDRRCFAFFHPAIPVEPLIFVEVALTKGTPTSIQALLSEDREEVQVDQINTAVFYSISNCQAGLANVSFGNFLIKQVASDLSLELPGLTTFITLSPIPGLVKWLQKSHPDWIVDQKADLRSLAAHYLIHEKSHNNLPLDPVARFHLGNGAIVEQIHADADSSENGKLQSLGCMVNYLYDLEQVTKNHEDFVSEGKVIASKEIEKLAKAFRL